MRFSGSSLASSGLLRLVTLAFAAFWHLTFKCEDFVLLHVVRLFFSNFNDDSYRCNEPSKRQRSHDIVVSHLFLALDTKLAAYCFLKAKYFTYRLIKSENFEPTLDFKLMIRLQLVLSVVFIFSD